MECGIPTIIIGGAVGGLVVVVIVVVILLVVLLKRRRPPASKSDEGEIDTAEEMHEYATTRPVAPVNTLYQSLDGNSTLDVNVSFMLLMFSTDVTTSK